ncbi:CRE-SEA-2 protein [Caenorhabditis remanei]|uniref:CRE-SEA-2 protein n=1 Tax=Caenorhabditis remanei TaxID=31234 RepID=E3MQL3_CAERE|nr:CRE-SEA-2 protein [Caenorhabditis remanei]
MVGAPIPPPPIQQIPSAPKKGPNGTPAEKNSAILKVLNRQAPPPPPHMGSSAPFQYHGGSLPSITASWLQPTTSVTSGAVAPTTMAAAVAPTPTKTSPLHIFCQSCSKTVSSDRSLRRHYNTCKQYQAELAKNAAANDVRRPIPPPPIRRKPAAPKKGADGTPAEKNSAILKVLNSQAPPPPPHMGSSAPFQYHGGSLPSISASWLQPTTSVTSGAVAPTTMAAAVAPTPTKTSPLQILLNDEFEEDGDSRSSSGTTTTKAQGTFVCERCSKKLCSMSNLKRHRATCKAAPSTTTTTTTVSEPPTPAPPLVVAPPPTAAPAETTATVTYTAKASWSPDLKLKSPKQKTSSATVTTTTHSELTVGEALKAQHQNLQMTSPRFPGTGSRILPPRPPNPILNLVQNPPQNQMQNQMQNPMVTSRLPPPPQIPIQIQNPPTMPMTSAPSGAAAPLKKGIIEHKNTDLVLITSEPIPEKKSRQEATPLPPIQLPPPPPQRPAPVAYQVQFTSRRPQIQNSQNLQNPQNPPHHQMHRQFSLQNPIPQIQKPQRPSLRVAPPPTAQYVKHDVAPQAPQPLPPPQQKMVAHAVESNSSNQKNNEDTTTITTAPLNPKRPGSPLDSIITSVPLSVEVHHHNNQMTSSSAGNKPEQGLSSADSQQSITDALPNSQNKKLIPYVCPECDKTYSCRKNVKRHRMAVHKMSLDEILAKPEHPAPPDAIPSAQLQARRHTVAGVESVGGPPIGKRKASEAVGVPMKKGKVVAASDDEEEEPQESPKIQAPPLLPPAASILVRKSESPVTVATVTVPTVTVPAVTVAPVTVATATVHPSWDGFMTWPEPEPTLATPRFSDEEDNKAMAKIAAELKRCAEIKLEDQKRPQEDSEYDAILFKSLREEFSREDVKVEAEKEKEEAELKEESEEEAESEDEEEAEPKETSTAASSVGLPSLSSPTPVQYPAWRPLAPPPPRRSAPPTKMPRHMCTGCSKVLGSDYSLRRHRTGCASVQKIRNPHYPKPPAKRRTAAEKAAAREEAFRKQITDAREAMKEMEALPLPPAVWDVIEEVKKERQEAMSHSTFSPPPPSFIEETPDFSMFQDSSPSATDITTSSEFRSMTSSRASSYCGVSPPKPLDHFSGEKATSLPPLLTLLSSSKSTSSAVSAAATSSGGPMIQSRINQARHMCQECGKFYCSEWNLNRHHKQSCPAAKFINETPYYEPKNDADRVDVRFMRDDAWGRMSRSFLVSISPLVADWLENEKLTHLQLDTKWQDMRLLLDVMTKTVQITLENVHAVGEQSKFYQTKQVDAMIEEFWASQQVRMDIRTHRRTDRHPDELKFLIFGHPDIGKHRYP